MAEETPTKQGWGLVGGRRDLRVQHGDLRPFDHPLAIDWFLEDGAAEARARAAEFVAVRPLELEIGFGRGRFLAELAAAHPERRFLGFEVRVRWCNELIEILTARGLTNARVLLGDVREILPDLVPEGALSAIYLLFPDPWWKKRHHKRRLLTPETVEMLRSKLAPDGSIWVKSDVPLTIRLAEEAFAGNPGFVAGDPSPAAAHPATDRELRCHRVGLPVHIRRFVRTHTAPGTALPTGPSRAEDGR